MNWAPAGLVFAMLDEIASTLNFTYAVSPPDDNSFGFKKKGSNEYDGMVGQLIREGSISTHLKTSQKS